MTLTITANNGRAPASALSPLPGKNGNGSQHTAPHYTVAGYDRIRAHMIRAGLGDLLPTDGWSCYRSLAAQQHMIDLGLTTTPPGTSLHGEWHIGSAVDFAGLGGFSGARHKWLKANGTAFGWYQPGWAQVNGSLPEPWHWEYDSRRDQHHGEAPEPPPEEEEEEDMFWFIRRNDGYIVIVGPTGVRGITFEQWDVYTNLGYAEFRPGFEAMDPGPFDVVIASLGGIVG